MLGEYLKISTQSLKRRGLRSWLTMVGIIIGIAAVVSLISLSQGLEQAVSQQFQLLGVERISVQARSLGFGPPGTSTASPLTEADLDVVRRVRGVDLATGFLIEPVMVEVNEELSFEFVGSLPRDTDERNYIIETNDYEVQYGRMLRSNDRYSVLIGYNYYDRPVLGNTRLDVRDRIIIGDQEFTVIGVMERTGSFQTDGSMVVNEEVLREVTGNERNYATIFAKAENVNEIDDVAQRIRSDLRRHRGDREGQETFSVTTPQQLLDTFSTVLNVVTAVVVGIAAISLVVGGVGIANTMYMSVMERTRDIGVMKAIGARNRDVLSLFLLESGLLGLAGGAIGVAIGLGFAKLVEFIAVNFLGVELLQAIITIPLVAGALLFSFLLGSLFGITPALSAARMNPVDALRKA